ncbi:phospholipase D-like domain-containing protein [Polaromonas sp. C04]|uniref:phospholipase D-like domain-containing protein n=1 Tax=Polaromonas sp. C04 TaxID=1945857 RepID=UPI000986B57A|nr:phospholipase D-like domain-containing protein [Polaromonas sp. C04]
MRLAGCLFTSQPVVRALIAAERRGVDVKILIDDRDNRDAASRWAQGNSVEMAYCLLNERGAIIRRSRS